MAVAPHGTARAPRAPMPTNRRLRFESFYSGKEAAPTARKIELTIMTRPSIHAKGSRPWPQQSRAPAGLGASAECRAGNPHHRAIHHRTARSRLFVVEKRRRRGPLHFWRRSRIVARRPITSRILRPSRNRSPRHASKCRFHRRSLRCPFSGSQLSSGIRILENSAPDFLRPGIRKSSRERRRRRCEGWRVAPSRFVRVRVLRVGACRVRRGARLRLRSKPALQRRGGRSGP